MAQINIRDQTRDRINQHIAMLQSNASFKITQDYIITKALNTMEAEKNV